MVDGPPCVVIHVKCEPNRLRGYGAVGGRKWPFPITLANGLYNSLYYRTSRDEPPRALAASTIMLVRIPSLLGRCKQKQSGLLCGWPSITEWEMYITAQGPRLQNDLYCVEWDVKL